MASSSFAPSIVFPGEDVSASLLSAFPGTAPAPSLRLGAGLSQLPAPAALLRGSSAAGAAAGSEEDEEEEEDGAIVATRAGVLSLRPPNRFYVASSSRRYVPAVGDTVVGVVLDRATEFYRVRLHATGVAQLPVLAFDGATKRNKPSLAVGATVFARVAACHRHLDPELSCTAAGVGPKKDWMTGQSVFGELKGGTLLRVPTGHARRLLDPRAAVLTALGAALPFEVAVGVNGTVWVQAAKGEVVCGWRGMGWVTPSFQQLCRSRAARHPNPRPAHHPQSSTQLPSAMPSSAVRRSMTTRHGCSLTLL